jgi:hypothetical protein
VVWGAGIAGEGTVEGTRRRSLSLSCEFDSGLFDDFGGADACAVIHDGYVFAQRLDAAAKNELDGWHFHHNPVQYFDPYERRKDECFDAAMCKDFRFAYQREYRFYGRIWAARRPATSEW